VTDLQPTPSAGQAALSGVLQGIAAAAPAIAVAAGAVSPQAQAIIMVAQAFEPFVAQIVAAQQAGLLTDAQVEQIVSAVKANITTAHSAWVASVAANPGV
jgi:hypothetical protein